MTERSDPLSDLTVKAFLDRLADRTPTPGGGGAAALTGAVSAAMAHMVGAYSVNKQSDEDRPVVQSLCDQLIQADGMLRILLDEDARAYEALAAAQRAQRQGHDDPAATARAVAVAVAVPMEMMAVAGNALSTMQQLLPRTNPHLLSDLGVAAVLADACARAAAYSVRVNVPLLKDPAQRDEVLEELARMLQRCAVAVAAIESALPEAIRPTASKTPA